LSTFVQYPANVSGGYNVPFVYIEQAHVTVYVNGVPVINGAHYDWVSATQIQFRPQFIPPPNSVVEVRRTTPQTALVQFQNAAVLGADDLNTATRQALYGLEELRDLYEARFDAAAIRLSNGNFTNAQNLIDAAVASVLDSELLAELQTRIADIDANGESLIDHDQRLTSLQAVVDSLTDPDGGGVATLIANETTARIAGDNALIDTLALLGAKSGDNTAFIADLNKLKVSPTESFAQRFSALAASDSANSAAITTEQTARVNADNGLASSISTLSTTVNGNTASLQTISQVVSGTGGLTSQWMVKTDVNGYVSGFGLYNNGATSDFTILANRFAVVTPGQSPKVPFVISGGVCYLQNVVIQNALIESLTVGKLTSGTLVAAITQNADWTLGTGRIIWSNGAYMKVSGIGFGSSNDLLEWFGPAMSISSCSRANGTQWLATNGDAYFGGSLRAGTLYNAIQTSDLSSTAQVTLGPYGTNGAAKTIVMSYSCGVGTRQGSNPSSDTFPCTATLQLYRKIGSGGEVLVHQDNFSGGGSKEFLGGGSGWQWSWSMGGSITYTDNDPSTGDRTYRAVITSRSSYDAPAFQRIGITSQE
jgi:hypothetical protein